jgi:hypothetical protein
VPASKRTAQFRCVIALAKPIEAAPCHDQKAHPSPLTKGGLRRARVGDSQAAARKSTRGFEERPQRDYAASPITGLDPALEQELGLTPGEPEPDARAETIKSTLDKYRLPKADLPTPGAPGDRKRVG